MDILLSHGKIAKFLKDSEGVTCRIAKGQRAISLGYVETNAFISCLDTIIAAAKESWTTAAADVERAYHRHLGFRIYATVSEFKGAVYVDIRQWWVPSETSPEVPTKTGVILSEADIETLAAVREDLLTLYPSPVEPCRCASRGRCARCRPTKNRG